ncbi:MAG: hypothetical protein KME13_22470 [Myxacorys californica WJT36-NPBG1]|jgi:hypothetical protein|nr:hypothetical protein [Myxacorys californica WJT36-NPBG1]
MPSKASNLVDENIEPIWFIICHHRSVRPFAAADVPELRFLASTPPKLDMLELWAFCEWD